MTDLELERAENEIRARKSDGKHQTRIAVVYQSCSDVSAKFSAHFWYSG